MIEKYNQKNDRYQECFSGTFNDRVSLALQSLRQGSGVILMDDENRENEGDLIFSAEYINSQQMALMIREGSGIVCLSLTEEWCDHLNLPPMEKNNTSANSTAFMVSIEAAQGITTGVSAQDRVHTIKAATMDNAVSSDLVRPGHVFPLAAQRGGVLARPGHTEGTLDLMRLAGLKPAGVLCEIMNPDGTMARLPDILIFSQRYRLPVLTIEDIINYITSSHEQSA